VLPVEGALVVEERQRRVDCALPLDVPNHLRDRVLRRDRDQHAHVVRHKVTFQNLALLLLRQGPKHFSHPPAQFSVRNFEMNATWHLQGASTS
jgi:hypothetical protein